MKKPTELDVANLLVNALNLEIAPNEINPTAPLFGDGLGLDSIDGLEVGMAIKKEYGISVEGSDVKSVFSSLRSIHEFIQLKQVQVQ